VKKLPGNQPAHQSPTSHQQTLSVSTKVVSGPLPSPEILAQFDLVVPGSAERIIAMAEHDFAHLQSMEKMRLSAYSQDRRLGQIFGFSIAVLALSGSIFLAVTGHESTASVIGGTTLVALVSIFVLGRVFRNSKPSN
jgi:uncharacterized membrane protein